MPISGPLPFLVPTARISTRPPDRDRRPPTILSRVLLPHPLGPRMLTNSPSAIVREMSESAWTACPDVIR